MKHDDGAHLLRGITNKDQRKLIAAALERGWSLSITRGTHVKLTHPSGAVVFTALTSGGGRGTQNLASLIRRTERKADG